MNGIENKIYFYLRILDMIGFVYDNLNNKLFLYKQIKHTCYNFHAKLFRN